MGSPATKVSDKDRKRARTAYYQKHGYEPSNTQLDTFLITYVVTDGFGSGAVSGHDSTPSAPCETTASYDSSPSYSSSDSSSSYSPSDSGSSDSGGGCGGGGGE